MLIVKLALLTASLALFPAPGSSLPSAPPCWNGVCSNSDPARDLLKLALSNQPLLNFRATVLMRGFDGHDQTAVITYNTAGEERIEFTAPDFVKGLVIVDNLVTRTTYSPGNGTLTVGKSPRGPFNVGFRIRDIESNYRLSSRKARLAHRDIQQIIAKPYWSALPTVSLYVDPKSGFLMERTAKSPSGAVDISYRTLSLTYLDSVDSKIFSVAAEGNVTARMEHPPRFVHSMDEAKDHLPFDPVKPERLPHGFKIQHMFLVGQRHYYGLGIMISNGLAVGTIFEYSRDDPPSWLQNSSGARISVAKTKSVTAAVTSFESKSVRQEILKSIP